MKIQVPIDNPADFGLVILAKGYVNALQKAVRAGHS